MFIVFRTTVQCVFFLVAVVFLPIIAGEGFGLSLMKAPDVDRAQVVCSIALLSKYFNSGESLSGSVLYMSITSASRDIQKSLLEALHITPNVHWTIVIRDLRVPRSTTSNFAVLHEKPQSYFVVIENLEDEDLEDIFEDWKTTVNWNPLAQFVVFLSTIEETDEEMTELMIEVLLYFMNKKIYNVNVIGQNEENGYFYGKTVFPYHPDNNCGSRVISIETLDVCDYLLNKSNDSDDNDEDSDDNYNEVVDVNNKEEEDDTSNNDDENDNEKDENDENASDDDNKSAQENDETEKTDGDNITKEENESVSQGNQESETEENEKDNSSDDHDIKNEVDDTTKIYENNDEASESEVEDQTKRKSGQENFSNEKESNEVDDAKLDNSSKRDEKTELDENENGENINEENHQNQSKDESSDNSNERDKNSDYISENENKMIKKRIKKQIHISQDIDDIEDDLNTEAVSDVIDKDNKLSIMKIKADNDKIFKGDHASVEEELDEEFSATDKNETENESDFYLEEIYRALFLDKFPKDLSGCPLIAAYRPWEPYIFLETAEETIEEGTVTDNEQKVNHIDYNDNQDGNDYGNAEYGENGENDEDNDKDTDAGTSYDDDTDLLVEDSKPKTKLSGIEFQLLQTIGERLNINIDIQMENRNLYHLFQQLIDGDIEMVVGGIDEDPSISQFVSTTIPYHQDDLTWCVAKARRSYNLFSFLLSFSPFAWLLTLIFAIIASLTVELMQKLLKLRLQHLGGYFGILIRVLGIIFSQSIPLGKMPIPIRLTFATTFVMSLLFLNAYQSFLVSTLTTPKSAYQISRIVEVYQHRMKIMGSVDNVRHLNKPGEVFQYVREKFQMCYNIEECLIMAADNDRLAVAVSRQHSFYNPRIPRSKLYCFDRNENLYVYLVTMLLPKKFHLLHKINPVIQHVIESGHIYKWARDLDMRRQILEQRNHVHEDTFRSLTLNQVVGTFVFTGVLLIFATLVLIIECCVHRLATKTKRRRTRLKIIRNLHRKFLQS